MPVAVRKSASERKKLALQRKKRKFKRKDPERSRAMKKAWKSKRTKMMKGAKTRKRLYQSADDFMEKFLEDLTQLSEKFEWEDVSENENEAIYTSENKNVTASVSITDEDKISVEVKSLKDDKVLETFSISPEFSTSVLKAVFKAYSKWEPANE
jgi:hypothetical protein